MFGKIRHVGIQTTDMEQSIEAWRGRGFEPLEVKDFRCCKVVNKDGMVMELIEGDYDPHISVNWVRDEDDNLFELVEKL